MKIDVLFVLPNLLKIKPDFQNTIYKNVKLIYTALKCFLFLLHFSKKFMFYVPISGMSLKYTITLKTCIRMVFPQISILGEKKTVINEIKSSYNPTSLN